MVERRDREGTPVSLSDRGASMVPDCRAAGLGEPRQSVLSARSRGFIPSCRSAKLEVSRFATKGRE